MSLKRIFLFVATLNQRAEMVMGADIAMGPEMLFTMEQRWVRAVM